MPSFSIDDLLEFLHEEWDALGVIPGPKPGPQHEALRTTVPSELFAIWQEFGFCGLDQGRIWLTDPLVWQDAADAFTETLDLAMGTDEWIPLVRSAFGDLRLWGPRTGPSLWIVPALGEVTPSDNSDLMATSDDGMVSSLVMGLDRRAFPLYDADTDRPLFEECLAKLGPVDADTMYTFVPVVPLGGRTTVETAVIEKAVPHLMLLASLQGSEVRGDLAETQRRREGQMDDWLNESE